MSGEPSQDPETKYGDKLAKPIARLEQGTKNRLYT